MDPFAVLADPTRRRLLDKLLDRERSVGELVDALGVNQPTVSKHLRVLREAGMVVSRIDAQRRQYRVDPTGLRQIDDWISAYRRLWSERLDALETHLNRRDKGD